MAGMDFFDRRILAVLRDGEPREFQRLLSEVGFSHNTLRLHLTRLEDQGLIEKQKRPRKGQGRPTFTYGLPRGVRRALYPSLCSLWWLSLLDGSPSDAFARVSRYRLRLLVLSGSTRMDMSKSSSAAS